MRWWIAVVVASGCGAAPNQPLLANAPRPNPSAVAGGAAAAAAAITLASPDSARGPEKKKNDENKKPINVKEHVTSDVLDRADQQKDAGQPTKDPADPNKQPDQPKSALDFGSP